MQKEELIREAEMLHNRMCYALGDPKRLLLLYALAERPRFVTELAEDLDIPQPTVSRHLKVLRDRALVVAERQGVSVEYRIADMRVIEALDLLRAVLADRTAADADLAQSGALDHSG